MSLKKINAALIEASMEGNLQIVDLMIKIDADVNAKDTLYGSTAIMFASQAGHFLVVKHLKDAGADINAKNTKNGQTAIMFAAEKGHLEVVTYLKNSGADLDIEDKDGMKAYDIAIDYKHTEVAEFLKPKVPEPEEPKSHTFKVPGIYQSSEFNDETNEVTIYYK